MFKRICWIFSGFLSFALIAFCVSSPVSAASPQGPYTAKYMTVHYSGSSTGSFRNNFGAVGSTNGSMYHPEYYDYVCFEFPGLSVDESNQRFNMSLTILTKGTYDSVPVSGALTGRSGVTVFDDVTSQSVQPANSYLYRFTHSISGYMHGSGNNLCFQGIFLANNVDTKTDWFVYAPTLSVYTANEQLQLQTQERIEALIKKGVNVNIDKAGLATVAEQKATTNAINDLKAQQQQAQQQQHADALAQKQATEAQTQQQKDQYDQEKAEENEREEQGKSDANQLAGIFNITVLNPFAGIWEIFNDGGCTNISTLANWLHSEQTVYCSWWPHSIRATLTPVFSIASMMILWGFVMRWLGGSEGFDVKVSGLSKGA